MKLDKRMKLRPSGSWLEAAPLWTNWVVWHLTSRLQVKTNDRRRDFMIFPVFSFLTKGWLKWVAASTSEVKGVSASFLLDLHFIGSFKKFHCHNFPAFDYHTKKLQVFLKKYLCSFVHFNGVHKNSLLTSNPKLVVIWQGIFWANQIASSWLDWRL